MKNRYFIIALLVSFFLTACHKEADLNKEPKVNEQSVEVLATQATFSWTVDYPGKRCSLVEISLNEDMSEATRFGSDAETMDKKFAATATGLTEATTYYYRYLVWNPMADYKLEVKNFTTKADVPKVKTVEVTEVTRTTAKVIAEVTKESGAAVTERGVCWGTSHNPTTSGKHSSEGTGIGPYSVTITELAVGKTYYVRAYAVNNTGTAYGEELSFITGDAIKPTVITAEITNIDWKTATGGGEVTDDGDATVTERGICWGTSNNPDISSSHAHSGTGTGNYSVTMTGLTAGTTYYVRAYAKNQAGVGYGNEVRFSTKAPELPTVTTTNTTDVSYTTAKSGGNVTSDGGTAITDRGICWSISNNPTTDDSHASNGTGTGSFTVEMTGLTAGTTYYVRAYAKNSVGTSYSDEMSFSTKEYEKPSVTTSSVGNFNFAQGTATGGGDVTSGGGLSVTERGIYFGTGSNPVATGTKLAAATVGEGVFTCTMTGLVFGTTYYICAYATNVMGTGYGAVLSFVYFTEGAVNGLFSVSASQRVYFSQGNLQYRASDDKWRFAEHQYDCLGNANSSISSSYNGWIDLFGWGTSGWNSGAVCYQPWSTSTSYSDYYPGGWYTNSLTGNYANADWGVYNKISNGGNQAGLWRTLTKDEWVYVFDTRGTSSGIRYAMACVNNVNGVILVPDDWSTSYYSLSNTNNSGASFTSNTITATQWVTLEQHGAVFLPAAGYRYGTSVGMVGFYGRYWSASYFGVEYVYSVYIDGSAFNPESWDGRDNGRSVRLVRSAP